MVDTYIKWTTRSTTWIVFIGFLANLNRAKSKKEERGTSKKESTINIANMIGPSSLLSHLIVRNSSPSSSTSIFAFLLFVLVSSSSIIRLADAHYYLPKEVNMENMWDQAGLLLFLLYIVIFKRLFAKFFCKVML